MAQPSMTAVMGVDDHTRYAPQQNYNPAMAMYGQQMAGAPVMGMQPGAAPYPLYGVPHGLGTPDATTPFYRTWGFAFAAGAASASAIWTYLVFIRPRMSKKVP
jgi:hypothetical protein